MKSPAEVLKEAKQARPRGSLKEYRDAIEVLRQKNYSWREIAQFLAERGVETDHTSVFRFMKQQGESKMENTEVFDVPTAEQYVAALSEIKNKITEAQMKMLGFHYGAHNRTATFTELAKAAGWDDYSSANLQYGIFGRVLGEQLGMSFWAEQGQEFRFTSIGLASQSKSKEHHIQVVMHHELAKAIERLGWFRQGE